MSPAASVAAERAAQPRREAVAEALGVGVRQVVHHVQRAVVRRPRRAQQRGEFGELHPLGDRIRLVRAHKLALARHAHAVRAPRLEEARARRARVAGARLEQAAHQRRLRRVAEYGEQGVVVER